MRYPLLFVSVAFVGGMLFARQGVVLFWAIIGWLVVVAGLSVYLLKRGKLRSSFLCCLLGFFLIGVLWLPAGERKVPSNHIELLFSKKGVVDFSQPVEIFGLVDQSPEEHFDRFYLYVRLERLSFKGKEMQVAGRVRLTVYHSRLYRLEGRKLEYGDFIRTIIILRKPYVYKNSGGFNYEEYLRRRGISLVGSVESPVLVEVLERKQGNSLKGALYRFRSKLSSLVDKCFITSSGHLSQRGAILKGMTLGERGLISEGTERIMKKSGAYHVLAISGLHIGIISYFLYLLFSFLKIKERWNCGLIIVLLALYAIMTGGRASVLRATIMATVYLGGRILYREGNFLNTISFSALVILLFYPTQLFDAGFQLTFIATLSIVLFAPRVARLLPFLPKHIRGAIAISLAAQLGLLPLLIYYFHRVSLVSILTNIAVFPLSALVVLGGFVFYLLSLAIPPISLYVSVLLDSLLRLFYDSFYLAGSLPHASYRIPTPPWWVVAGYFALVLVMLLPFRRRLLKWGTTVVWAGFAILLLTFPFKPAVSPYLTVTFFDVANGEAILVEFPSGERMLIDGGGYGGDYSFTGEYIISPFLWEKGVKRIDWVVTTHSHVDHINGLKAIIENFEIGEVWQGNSSLQNPYYRSFLRVVRRNGVPLRSHYRGDRMEISGVELRVLNPPYRSFLPYYLENDNSLVIQLRYKGVRVLLTGDIGEEMERELIACYGNELQSEMMKAAHHGSPSSNSDEFVEMVKPRIIVVCGKLGFRQDGTKSFKPEERIIVYHTNRDGQVTIFSDGYTFKVRTYFDSLLMRGRGSISQALGMAFGGVGLPPKPPPHTQRGLSSLCRRHSGR